MMQRWRHLRKIAIRGQNWFQTNLCGEWNFVANETLRLNRIQKMHVKRFFYFTCVFFCACAFVLDTTPSIGQTSKTDSAGSQTTEDSNRLRFKYEKRGAIVYAQGDDYELKCDLFVPESDSPRPIMLAIHGGAWTTGSKFAMTRHARILANRGYVVMAINFTTANMLFAGFANTPANTTLTQKEFSRSATRPEHISQPCWQPPMQMTDWKGTTQSLT
jgi:hypothetical protein